MHFVRKRFQHSFHFYGAKFILRIGWYVAYTNGCRTLPFVMFGAASFLLVGHLTPRRRRTSSHKYHFFHPARTPATSLFDATPDMFTSNTFFALYQQFLFFAVMWSASHLFMHAWNVDRKLLEWQKAQILADFTARFVAIICVPIQKPSHATKHAPVVRGNNVTTSSPCGDT
jgi:hypothetical protein